MVIKTVNLKDFAKEFKSFTGDLIKEQKAIAAKGIIDYFPDLIKNSPVDTGLYAQSWRMEETEESVLLGNIAPHAAIIEYGARPFTPPLAPLLSWAKRVLNDPSQPPKYSDSVWALAIYTQNKIKLQGMAPKHVMEKAIPEIIENIRKEFINASN